MPRKGYRKPAHEARTIPINVRLTPLEKTHLDAAVAVSDVMGTADFIRQLIQGFVIRPRRNQAQSQLIDELARLNRKLASIDNNMNQLARAANSGHIIGESDLMAVCQEHRALRRLAADALDKLARRR